MCKWAPVKYTCPQCGNDWSTPFTQEYHSRRLLKCNSPDPERCNLRTIPTDPTNVLHYSIWPCDACIGQITLDQARQDGAPRLSRRELEEAVELVRMIRDKFTIRLLQDLVANEEDDKKLLREVQAALVERHGCPEEKAVGLKLEGGASWGQLGGWVVKTHFKVTLGPQGQIWARINGDSRTEELAKALMRGGLRRMIKGVSAGQEACGDLLDFVQGHSALRFESWEEHEELDD